VLSRLQYQVHAYRLPGRKTTAAGEMPWPSVVMGLAGGRKIPETAVLPSSARTGRPVMEIGHPDRAGGISARSIHELAADTPHPAEVDGTKGRDA
jgi:hypothetical protein